MICQVRDGLPGWAPGRRRPCEACELLMSRGQSVRDPGPSTLMELVQGTGGLFAEARKLNDLHRQARAIADRWGKDSAEGDHARGAAMVLKSNLDHIAEQVTCWRRRLVRHPEMGAKPVTAKCPCQRDCLLMGDVATVMPMREMGDDMEYEEERA